MPIKMDRQGDLGFVKIEEEVFLTMKEKSEPLEINGELILAYGETTGHKHTVAVMEQEMTAYKLDNGMILFDVKAPVEVKHNVHKPITFSPGYYLYDGQFEYDELEEYKRVSD